MEQQWLLVVAVLAVGVFHTLVPDHWLPIALIARQQGWTKREVARAAAFAGTGHAVSTLLLGLIVWIAGVALATKFGNLVSAISSIALIGFGGWIAVAALVSLRSGGHGHTHGRSDGHSHQQGHDHGIHGSEAIRLASEHDSLELSVFASGQPPRFRLSGHSGDRVWIETLRDDGVRQRFECINCGNYWESLEDIPEPHRFTVTVHAAHGEHEHAYEAEFAGHDHGLGENDDHAHSPQKHEPDDALYVPASRGSAVLTRHVHAHRHGRSVVHSHLHDHTPETWHSASEVDESDPPVHEHAHRRPLRTTLLLIIGSSPMVEGIPAFFAAAKFGIPLIAVMAVVFALATIATYVVVSVASLAGLERASFGPLERYGEVISGGFILAVGIASLFWL
jgi:hypothetical protein